MSLHKKKSFFSWFLSLQKHFSHNHWNCGTTYTHTHITAIYPCEEAICRVYYINTTVHNNRAIHTRTDLHLRHQTQQSDTHRHSQGYHTIQLLKQLCLTAAVAAACCSYFSSAEKKLCSKIWVNEQFCAAVSWWLCYIVKVFSYFDKFI